MIVRKSECPDAGWVCRLIFCPGQSGFTSFFPGFGFSNKIRIIRPKSGRIKNPLSTIEGSLVCATPSKH